MIELNRFCLNRKAAPGISLEETIPLVASVEVTNIELRNDLYGSVDNNAILDHLSGKHVADLLKENHVSVETINAIGNMDKRDSIEDNLRSLTEMLEMSKDFSLKNIIFCPVRSKDDTRSSEQREKEAIANVKEYSKLLAKYNVGGLLEPLGFEDSTLRTPWEGQNVINKSGVDNFKLVADTFHYYLASVTPKEFEEKVDVNYIGLVHLSSVIDRKARNVLDDQDRYMLDKNDVMESAQWAKRFETAGYRGLYAFEPFSDDLKKWNAEKVKDELMKSIDMVRY